MGRGLILLSSDSVSVLLTCVHREGLAAPVMYSSLANARVKRLDLMQGVCTWCTRKTRPTVCGEKM